MGPGERIPEEQLRARLRGVELFAHLDESTLSDLLPRFEALRLAAGDLLFEQDDAEEFLYIVMEGRLAALARQGVETVQFGEIGPGETIGEIQMLTGGARTADVQALVDSEVVRLPRAALDGLAEESPELMRRLLEVIRRRLRRNQLAKIIRRVFGDVDEAVWRPLDADRHWVHLKRGDVLCRRGEVGESMWVLVSGQLVAVVEDEHGAQSQVRALSSGECVGEMAVVSGEQRNATVYAARDCDLVEISREAFDKIIERHPQALRAVTRQVMLRLRESIDRAPRSEVATIALAPAGPDVPVAELAERLAVALGAQGKTLHLSSRRVDGLFGLPGMAQCTGGDPRCIRLASWLEAQESTHRFVLLETDASDTAWTRRCLQYANRILVVAWASADPALGEVEGALPPGDERINQATRSLVLIHPDGTRRPSGTRHWLAARPLTDHHHLRWDTPADVARLARFLGDRAVGLVLGGGGARGFAHYGAHQALVEAGVPIDFIGGSSMGAVLGGQCALGWDKTTTLENNRRSLIETKPFSEYTLPIVSLLRCKKLDQVLRDFYGEDTRIEDLWTRFFCISSNLSTKSMKVHQQGRLWKALRASSSLPGVAVPVVDGHDLLVDGGVVNNLPGDVMRRFCRTVIVCNVSGNKEFRFVDGEIPSSWSVLWSRILPFRRPLDAPTLGQVVVGSMLLGSAAQASRVLADADFCLEPSVERFGLLQFEGLDELIEVGYRYTQEQIGLWKQQGRFTQLVAERP